MIGAGGFGREALDVVEAANRVEPRWQVLGVIDDAPSSMALERLAARGVSHLGGVDVLEGYERVEYLVAIGAPRTRAAIDARLLARGHTPAVVVHPTAVLGSQVVIGEGTVICSGVQVSTNVRLGRHVHLNPNATIGHDAVLDDFVSINPAAVISGEVCVQAQALIGAAAVVLQGLTVGAGAVVGAAACVTRDVAQAATVRGVPAR
ncbi:NeuD/PglB/VioB family sugar acetyltransferase [Agrococcus sp. HG114]|uniref:NeuD/PglB/VioB family sugar acetyltransferase n=1 Tax=Agrococcus sp. HG114 TaxID=2969757 RepID=UPI00215A1A7D|nr:NeuD/PglB/VioB family sugar acetyltransferase [Agrococcus sp. HG114]MCR8669852.1 NeuD/PglB/VioB family sugar acetyltransferase [Agrococcus sp. HG114]